MLLKMPLESLPWILLARLLPETAAKPLKLTLVLPAPRTDALSALFFSVEKL